VSAALLNPAIRFELDGYDMAGKRLMGRQSAGSGFLRAAVSARGETPLIGYGPRPHSAAEFDRLVRSIDPEAETRWIRADHLDSFNAVGVCYRPDPTLAYEAGLRLRVGPARHCLCGVTHTLSSSRATEAIAAYATAPMMPWDALICTSTAGLGVVTGVLEEQAEYLAWRLGSSERPLLPQLPVIPLGVHSEDFAFTDKQRHDARAALNLAEDEVAVLYAGRLAFADKAHPFAMFLALQKTVERTGRKVALVLAGRFYNAAAEATFGKGIANVCPDVRCILVDGGSPDEFSNAWASADLFVSAADSIQETFGLTPLEAMAAALPVVVSDWSGYRETVRDGVDGFRVRTWAPEPGTGDQLALAFEAEVIDSGRYVWDATLATSVDLTELVERLTALIVNPDLRRRMGQAGRARVRESFEWPDIYRQYQALWGELNARRLSVENDPALLSRLRSAPKAAAGRQDPFRLFGHYPTHHISPDTRLMPTEGASVAKFFERAELFPDSEIPQARVAQVLAQLGDKGLTVGVAAKIMRCSTLIATRTVAVMAKMGLLLLDPPIL
jgi:starch synthase